MACRLSGLVFIFLLWSMFVYSLEQVRLPDLREFSMQAVVSRSAVPRSVLEKILSKRATNCDIHLSLFMPGTTEETRYDTSSFGEIIIGHSVVHDDTLRNISFEMNKDVAYSYSIVTVSMPVVNGGQHSIIYLARFTDSDRSVFFPFSTNWKDMIYIDKIEEAQNGTITLRHGIDAMVMNTQQNDTCRRSHVGADFDKLSGKSITGSNYPLPFDWGCDELGHLVEFCDVLKQNEDKLRESGSNVCTEKTTTYHNTRCPASLAIEEMTGFFRKELPFLSPPLESFEAEWVDRECGVGIVFPCFTV